MKIKWREVFKFLSGAALARSLMNGYLWLTGISVLFLGYTITPRLLGLRAAVQFVRRAYPTIHCSASLSWLLS